jgi:hypothetical protein
MKQGSFRLFNIGQLVLVKYYSMLSDDRTSRAYILGISSENPDARLPLIGQVVSGWPQRVGKPHFRTAERGAVRRRELSGRGEGCNSSCKEE